MLPKAFLSSSCAARRLKYAARTQCCSMQGTGCLGRTPTPWGIKTDAPPDVLWDIMRCWVAQHPTKRPLDPESHTGLPLCAIAACLTLYLALARPVSFSQEYAVHQLQEGCEPAEACRLPLILLSGCDVLQHAIRHEVHYADLPCCTELSGRNASSFAAIPVLSLTAAGCTAGKLLSKEPKIQADLLPAKWSAANPEGP